MAVIVEIHFAADPADLNDMKVWAFAEELGRELAVQSLGSVSQEDIDRARDRLRLRVASRAKLRRAIALVGTLLVGHFLADRATVRHCHFTREQ